MYINRIRKHIFGNSHLLLLVGLILFILAGTLNNSFKKPALKLSKQDTALNINKDLLGFLSAGNKRLLTDLLWVQTLMESDLDHYSQHDLNSWMYLRFLTISYLDPRFYENYLYGGQYLGIVKDDLLGAVDIYQRGLKFYPDDYKLLYHLGFTYYFELSDYQNGIKYLKQIEFHPRAPSFLKVIVNKMDFETTRNFDLALAFVGDNLSKTTDKHLKEKLTKDFYALKAERDLRCLNSGKDNCDRLDAEGRFYYFKEGKYRSPKLFVPYRLKKKGDQSVPHPVDTI